MNRHTIVMFYVYVCVSGCTHVADRYSISVDNVTTLRSLKGQSVNIGPFSSAATIDPTHVQCAGVQISPPDGLSYTEYARQALLDELRMAELFSANAEVTLTGTLNLVDVSSPAFVTSGEWNLGLSLQSSNGKSLTVNEHYTYKTNFIETACEVSARTLTPAMQNLIGKLIHSAEFPGLLESR